MSAAWLAVGISALALIVTVMGFLWRDGRRDGTVDTILAGLVKFSEDHELRIRDLEKGRHRRR